MHRLRALLALVAVTITAALVGACSDSNTISVDTDTVIIDVRTPAEYAQGHLSGAVNIDLQSGTFEQQIQQLPRDGDYVVYCRTGSRSAQAASIMSAAGFTHIRDAGGIQDAADATGLSIVT